MPAYPAASPTELEDVSTPPDAIVPYGPHPPNWYTKPPRPELAEVLEAAEAERAMHAERIEQGLRMLRKINDPSMAGVFQRYLRDVLNHRLEQVSLPGIRDETDMIVGTFAQMDWTVEALYRSTLDREEAAAKEDLAAYLQENAQRQYSASGGGLRKAAKLFDLVVFGCVAEFNAIDVDNDECGVRMRLIDPNTIFPVWEGERGLSAVYLKYQTTASDFIGAHGSLDGFDEEMVRDSAGQRTQGGPEVYDPHYLGEVVEYWDRNWYLITWDSREVALGEHGYAEVPFTVTPGNFGMPAHVSSTTTSRHARDSAYWHTDRSEDLLRIYQPFLERRLALHNLQEAVAGIVVTKIRRSYKPPRTTRQSVLTYEDETPRWNDDDGETTKLRIEDEYDENDAALAIDPQIASATFALIQQGMATSTPSSIIAGQAPMSQGSGTALNVLTRAGVERWALAGEVMMQHEGGCLEQILRFLRDNGNLLGMADEETGLGTLYVPRRRPNSRAGQSPVHKVTTDLLKKTGIRVRVVFRRFNPSEISTLAQGVGMLRSINLIPKRDAIEIVGYTDDPDQAMVEMDREMLNEAPEMTQKNMLDMLIDELKEAAWRQDSEDMEKTFYALMYVADKLDTSQAQRSIESQQTKMAAQSMMLPGVNGMPLPGAGAPGAGGGRPQGAMAGPPGAIEGLPGLPPIDGGV